MSNSSITIDLNADSKSLSEKLKEYEEAITTFKTHVEETKANFQLVKDLSLQIKSSYNDFNAFKTIVSESGGGFDGFAKSLTVLNGPLGDIGNEFLKTDGGVKGFVSSLSVLDGPLGLFGEKFKTAGGGMDGLKAGFAGVLSSMDPLKVAFELITLTLTYLYENCEPFREFVDELAAGVLPLLQQGFANISDFIINGLVPALETLWGIFQEYILPILLQVGTFIIENIVPAFATIVNFIIENVLPIIMELGTFLYGLVATIIEVAANIMNGIINLFSFLISLPGKLWELLNEMINFVIRFASDFIAYAIKAGSEFISNIISFVTQLPEKIWNWLSKVIEKITLWTSDLVSKGTQAASDLVSTIVEGISSLPGKMLDIGKNLVEGIWDGITGAGEWLSKKIKTFCDDVVDNICEFFSIFSPSRLMRDRVGKMLPPGIAIGFEMAVPDATKAMKNSLQDLDEDLQSNIDLSNYGFSAGIALENTAKFNSQNIIANSFPKSMELINRGSQRIELVLDNGQELAHALAQHFNKEIALLY